MAQFWILETSSMPFYDFNKMAIQLDLSICSSWYLPFLFSNIHPFKKMKHWKLDIISYWLIGAGCLIEKGLELSPSPPNHSNDFRKILTLLISTINCDSKHIFKNAPCLMYQYSSWRHRFVKSRDGWKYKNLNISWEWRVTFLWSKKIHNLCLRWHI